MKPDLPDLKQLEAFCAVVAVGSLTGAARFLGRSQPAMTRLIQELEASLGFALFHRNGPRIVPTEQGMLFHMDAERLMANVRRMNERVAAIAQDQAPSFEIAAIPALATGLIPYALAQLSPALLPKAVHVQSVSAERVVQSVMERTADLGAASFPVSHPELDVLWVGQSRCVAVLDKADPLVSSPVVRLADLASRRLVTIANPYRLRSRVEKAFAKIGGFPPSFIDTNTSVTALAMVRAQLGVAIVEPATACGLLLQDTVVRPLDTAIPFFFGIVKASGRPLTPGLDALVDALRTASAAQLPEFVLHERVSPEITEEALHGLGGPSLSPLPGDWQV
ncbi:LysR family transcriptional regulator [Acetobacter persici]|uniref:LysR family transcriptional regulator n=1 Tax=Acetobacter persici TaxID=1076596 RepID=UPI0020CD9E1F|nr:LysR family transcriptional regulator [Acetobacter persici]MCP9319523.1 LysR family transcriptional regulator [Acetobacter persici]